MRISRIWLLTLAVMGLAVSLAAEEINAPQPRWQDAVPQVPAQAAQVPTETAGAETQPATYIALAGGQTPGGQDSGTPGSGQQTTGTQAPPATQGVTPTTAAEQSRRDKAEAQLKEQEKQRVLGIVPSFNVSYRDDAVSLTGSQKIRLAFRSSVDPVTFAVALLVGGYHEVADDESGFPWGAKGYGERAGAAYLDTLSSNMIGNGILPAVLHQDPRYFRLGHGSKTHRLLYAASMAFICKHDNTGKWEPNYSNIGGNIAAGALSNLYYPGNNSGVGLTIENGVIVTAEGAFGAMFQEFWPDISRKLFHKDPTQGRDAQTAADQQKSK